MSETEQQILPPEPRSLTDPVALILQEIVDRRMHRRDVAITYALVMQYQFRAEVMAQIERRKPPPYPFERIDAAILGRWKFSGLKWVKERAWKILRVAAR